MVVSITENTRSAADLAIRILANQPFHTTPTTNDEEHDLSMRQLSALQFIDGTDRWRRRPQPEDAIRGCHRTDRSARASRLRSPRGQCVHRRRVYIELTTAGGAASRDDAEDQLAKRFDDLLLAKLSDEEIALVRGEGPAGDGEGTVWSSSMN